MNPNLKKPGERVRCSPVDLLAQVDILIPR